MKKIIGLIIILILACCFVLAEDNIKYTQETNIKCYIDYCFIESYAIDGHMYIPVERLADYGFEVENTNEEITLKRKTIFYLDGDYTEKETKGQIAVYENSTPVTANGKTLNSYSVDGKIVIKANELSEFGEIEFTDYDKKVSISVVGHGFSKALEEAEDLVKEKDETGNIIIRGQKVNGKWNGIVETGYFQGMTYIGYMVDGEYEGVVYSYRKHQPYLAEQTEIQTIKNGKKNGFCRYKLGYNNKPPSPNEVTEMSGVFEDGRLKNGRYTIITDIALNCATYDVRDFEKILAYSSHHSRGWEDCKTEVYFGGKKLEFEILPILENNRILVPMSTLNSLGATVLWDEKTETVTATKDNISVSMKADYHKININGAVTYTNVPVRITDKGVMIPLRSFAQALGYQVLWDNNRINII